MENKNSELTLEEYATHYIKLKAEADSIDKELKAINKRMKELMVEEDVTEAHCDDGVVKYVVQHRETFDEDKAIKILKKSGTECIKTKEYIDSDILEKELYNEKLAPDIVAGLDSCRTIKDVPTLTISKNKGA